MSFPEPKPGLVIRYSYLWRSDFLRGQQEGVKDRPCAVLLAVQSKDGQQVIALPVTHVPPHSTAEAVEIPALTKRRLGLDDQRSWIILSEANRFIWPGPDLRPRVQGDAQSVAHGLMPKAIFDLVRKKWLALYEAKKTRITPRTE